jgi:flagellin-like hook-associated protein FlgL
LEIDLDGDGGADITADFSLSGGGAVRNLAVSFDLVGSDSGGSDWDIETSLFELESAKSKLRTSETTLSNSLNTITTRNTFADKMISVLEEGGANLINADMNEEAANMLMLQTRQAIASSILKLAAQNSVNLKAILSSSSDPNDTAI